MPGVARLPPFPPETLAPSKPITMVLRAAMGSISGACVTLARETAVPSLPGSAVRRTLLGRLCANFDLTKLHSSFSAV